MWKRLLALLFVLIGILSLRYIIDNMRLLASSTYDTGGNVTMKLGEKGQYPNGTYGAMRKGDKVYSGAYTDSGDPMSFILLVNENYNTYKQIIGSNGNYSLDMSAPNITGWFALANESYASDFRFFSSYPSDLKYIYGGAPGEDFYISENYLTTSNISNMAQTLKSVNDSLSSKTRRILLNRNLNTLQGLYDSSDHCPMIRYLYSENLHHSFLTPKGFYLPDQFTVLSVSGTIFLNDPVGGYCLDSKDLVFYEPYFESTAVSVIRSNTDMRVSAFSTSGTQEYLIFNSSNYPSVKAAIRLGASLDMSNVVFASGIGNGSGKIAKAKNTGPALEHYSNIYAATADYDKLKLRLLDNSNSHSITFNGIENGCGETIFDASTKSVIYINADAKAGSSDGDVNTVSALFFKNNELVYYVPIEAAKGQGTYELDLNGIDTGEYKVALVNESYNANDMGPVECSALTSFMDLKVVKSSSDLSFKANSDLEVSKNVNAGDAIGSISSMNGTENYVYQIIADPAYPKGYTYLKLADDNKTVIVDDAALHAGTYHFKIQVKDNPCDTVPADEITVSFTVRKTNLTIVFNDPNTTKKSMTDAATAWNETATASPSAGVKITYSKTGGFSSLIEIDSQTGQVTYNGNNAFNKVMIRATADDDPSTGNDNYDPVYVEKEIIIYRGVNATLIPDSASSDTTTPTFTASQANIKGNGVIGTIQGTEGTPDTIGGTQTSYRYEIVNGQDSGMFQITTSSNKGTIKVKAGSELGVGSYHFTVRVSDNWSSKDIAVTVNVGVAGAENLQFYETSAAVNMITSKSVKVTDTNVAVFACVKGSTNTNQVKYKIKDGSTNIIEINENSGAVTIHSVGTVTIVAEKQGATGQADAYAELTFTVTAGAQNFIYTDDAGNELPKSGSNYSAKKEVYEPNKTFQLYTAGNPTGSTVSYQLKAGSPTDVISVDASGLVTILNASLNTQMGKVIVQATSHDPSGNYSDKTIELPINIDKGTRVIKFADDPIYVVNGSGSVTPVVEVDGIVDTSGDVLIEVDSNEDSSIAWTNDNKTIEYDYTESSPKDIKIHATKPMDRNYKAAEADGTIHIMGPDENVLAITSPGKITYGDHFTIKSTQFDADSTNVQYTFEIDDTTYVSNPTVNGNIAEFDALKYSGTTKTTITVTRTADGESPLSKKVQVTVLPKSITITIDNKEKLKGEQNPALTYQDFRNQLVSWNGIQDIIQENDIKLSTTAKTGSNAGSYPIKGDSNTLNKTYPNYSFSFKEGILTINEENIEDDWYHLEIDDGNNTAYTNSWTNQNVNIISDHSEYINLSLDQSTWRPNQVTVTKEGETNQGFWMKKDSGAITKEKQETIKIDKTAPKVKGIKAKDTNNKLQDIINKLSGGIFFKPGTAFEITTDDSKDNLKVSGTKAIAYKVYQISDGTETEIKNGTLTVTNEKASITISETVGKYKVCVIPADNAGNINKESCHEVELKKIDIDVDKDGKPDFNDSDGDGCPDLNIKWKDPNDETKWIVINGDRDYDGIPDLNIDSDGDGKADLNVDTDNDGKPDLNLIILKKSDWKPTKCVKKDIDKEIPEEYCTGTNVKAVINVDIDGDRIPDINIDNTGDFKPHINISKDGKTPIINIADIHKWEPIHDYKTGITYDSISAEQEEYKRKVNIDTDGDGRPDVNVDLDNDGKPDINIDLDGDEIPDIDIDGDGDGKPDINVDLDGNGTPDENIKEISEWKPEKNVDGELPYDTMSFDEKEEPNDPDKPSKPTEQGNKTDVKGAYYPGDSIGGAITGDETNLMLPISMTILGLGIITYLLYRYQKDTF